jgi:parvulin-like peptidyl-prolyl isomerase
VKTALVAAALVLAAAAPDPVVAVRGTDQITASQVRALIAGADPQTRAKLKQDPAALQTLIRNALLQRAILAAAHAANWDRKPDIAALLARTREATMTQSFLAAHAAPPAGYPSDADIQAAYEQAKPQLMQPRAYHITQEFIALADNAPQTAIDQARHTLAGQQQAYASAHPAKPPSGIQTADLGWVPETRLQQAARETVSGLLEGQVSAPICTKSGCALLKLVATRPAGPAPLADIRDRLVQVLRQQKERQGEQAYANTLLAQQPVRVDEIQLSHLTAP